MKRKSASYAFTLIEMMMSLLLVSTLGFVIYSILTTTIILGAKNSGINVTHQQSRGALLRMIQGIHSAVSLPVVSGSTGSGVTVSFQQFASGPHQIIQDAAITNSPGVVHIAISAGYGGTTQPLPVVGQRLIVPSPQIEDTITAVSGGANNVTVTLTNPLPSAINNTGGANGDVICYITDPCSYAIAAPSPSPQPPYTTINVTKNTATGYLATGISSQYSGFDTPASLGPNFVNINLAGIDRSTYNYTLRQFNVSRDTFLNVQVPIKYKLTAFAGAP
jgi:hypothetical protein